MKQKKAKFSKGHIAVPFTVDTCPNVFNYIYLSFDNDLLDHTHVVKASWNKDILFVVNSKNQLVGIELANETVISARFFNQLKKMSQMEYSYFPVQTTPSKSGAKKR